MICPISRYGVMIPINSICSLYSRQAISPAWKNGSVPLSVRRCRMDIKKLMYHPRCNIQATLVLVTLTETEAALHSSSSWFLFFWMKIVCGRISFTVHCCIRIAFSLFPVEILSVFSPFLLSLSLANRACILHFLPSSYLLWWLALRCQITLLYFPEYFQSMCLFVS